MCDRSPSGQPNAWLRSDAIKVNNARRIDVTIEYSATNCSAFANPRYCRHSFDLYAHQATDMYTPDKIPDPYSNPKVYDKVGMVNPQFVAYPKIDKIKNLETHPFEIKPGYSYVYLALHYTGGCFVVYGLSAHYYQCPSKAMSKSLIQLPQTMSPLKGPLQVKGSCARHAKPRTNEDDLYGYCEAEGRWSEDSYKGVCLCEAGYHEVNSSSGTECKGKFYFIYYVFIFLLIHFATEGKEALQSKLHNKVPSLCSLTPSNKELRTGFTAASRSIPLCYQSG